MMNAYKNKILKYPLNNEEYEKIEKVWEYVAYFKKKFIYISEYRKYIIKEIRRNYNIFEFYEYEKILNKMYWNLKWLLYPLIFYRNIKKRKYEDIINNNYKNQKEIPQSLLLCTREKYNNRQEMITKIKKKN